jgi:hypothetical protein
MIAVFIYELVVNAQAQGSPVSFHVSQTSYSSLLDLQLQSNPACRQPNVGTFGKCPDSGWCALSTVYEERITGTSDTNSTL